MREGAMARTSEPRAKRRKLDHEMKPKHPATAVASLQDLKDLLRFRQSTSPEVKQNIQQFKQFLEGVENPETGTTQTEKLGNLKVYCDDQVSGHAKAISFSDLISTWSFAAQSNNDPLLTAVPAVLALLLRTISAHIEFRDIGISLCRTLLQKDQLRLLDRGLAAVKTKEHLISPVIRLLTEVVSFDGGAVANLVYAKRDIVFKRLDQFLDTRGSKAPAIDEDDEERRRKPTLRRNAQRYVIANLKFQSEGAKGDMLLEGKILRALLQGISRDGTDIIADALETIDKEVVNDAALSRKAKSRFLNALNLGSLASLYGVTRSFQKRLTKQAPKAVEPIRTVVNGEEEWAMPDIQEDANQHSNEVSEEHAQEAESVRLQVHSLLLKICTQSKNGVLLESTGWYPAGSDPNAGTRDENEEDTIDLGLDSPDYFDTYQVSSALTPVANRRILVHIANASKGQGTSQERYTIDIRAKSEACQGHLASRVAAEDIGNGARTRGRLLLLQDEILI